MRLDISMNDLEGGGQTGYRGDTDQGRSEETGRTLMRADAEGLVGGRRMPVWR